MVDAPTEPLLLRLLFLSLCMWENETFVVVVVVAAAAAAITERAPRLEKGNRL